MVVPEGLRPENSAGLRDDLHVVDKGIKTLDQKRHMRLEEAATHEGGYTVSAAGKVRGSRAAFEAVTLGEARCQRGSLLIIIRSPDYCSSASNPPWSSELVGNEHSPDLTALACYIVVVANEPKHAKLILYTMSCCTSTL